MSKKSTSINVQDTSIRIVSVNDEDYISLTDMLRAKDGDFLSQIGLETEIRSNSSEFGSGSTTPISIMADSPQLKVRPG